MTRHRLVAHRTRIGMRRSLIAVSLAAAVATGTSPAGACTLRVGWEPWPPYQMAAADGPKGMDIRMVRAIAEEAKCRVTFVRRPWSRLLAEIRAGDMDAAMAASKNAERAAYAHFTRPYRHERVGIVVRADDTATRKLPTLQAMLKHDRLIGYWRDYNYGPRVRELRSDPANADAFVAAGSARKLLRLLNRRRVDAVLGDPVAEMHAARRAGIRDKIAVHEQTVFKTPVRLMLSNASVPARVRKRLNAAIERLRGAGTLERIYARYVSG